MENIIMVKDLNDLKMHIIIRTNDEKEKMRIGRAIHYQLVGNRDYTDCNIILNVYNENEVNLYIFNECKNVPDIVI